ncbi:MAG: bifunctional aspartate kinase/diaminopimelate decarboxylase [Gemmatimonadota bacterium]
MTRPPEPTPSPPQRIVLKFGGSSVSSRSTWNTILAVVTELRNQGHHVLVVHSALAGVTNLLEALPDRSRDGDPQEILDALTSRHMLLAQELGVDGPALLDSELQQLQRIAAGVALLDEVTPRIRARILAFGERMATVLGAAFLKDQGLAVDWLDARELLTSEAGRPAGTAAHWLSAECSSDLDPELSRRLDELPGVALTQGFTARDTHEDTVVLGRGGSDTAAAYLAGGWGADRLEIWSDVPGMFTADPRLVPGARLLRKLGYQEAQEISTTGSKVLHPRCVPAVRSRGIPIHLRSTLDPSLPGTIIGPDPDSGPAQVKAISWKSEVVLVSMETVGMWHEVGFLARAFQVFEEVGLSVDLVSTSETNVTVSLDPRANLLEGWVLDRLVEGLTPICRVQVIRPCAAVSLVGNRIRGLLHRLGPALQAFEEHRIHLVSQAASDLNLTVVVDEDQAERLVRQLHSLLISGAAQPEVFGPTWQELLRNGATAAPPRPRWWRVKQDDLVALCRDHGAAYAYHLPTVATQLRTLMEIPQVDRVFYAMKANAHPAILRTLVDGGGGLECVSQGELEHVQKCCPHLPPQRLIFTPNFAPREEYVFALDRGIPVTLDALHPLQHWGQLFQGREVFLRMDPGWGSGHHEKVVTGGRHSKFGIPFFELDELLQLVDRHDIRVVGLHTHSGSGILAPDHWGRVGETLAGQAHRFPHLRALNLGGGLGVPEKPGQEELDLPQLATGLATVKEAYPGLELWLEPGRFLVAEAGVLLAQVTQVKGKGEIRYVGLATGMNSLLRPALYGAFHEIVNLTRLDEPGASVVQVVGPICESGDRLGSDRLLPETREGDVLLVATAGAYGRVMGSRYNLREPAPEFALQE